MTSSSVCCTAKMHGSHLDIFLHITLIALITSLTYAITLKYYLIYQCTTSVIRVLLLYYQCNISGLPV